MSATTAPKRTAAYTTCPACKGLNMFHRATCYRCGTALSELQQDQCEIGSAIQVSVGAAERRRHHRYNVYEKGEVRSGDLGARYDVNVRNISAGGLLFDAKRPYKSGEQLWLRIRLEGCAYSVQAKVRQSKELVNSDLSFETGVEFLSPDPLLIEHVKGWERRQYTAEANAA